jgi:hypothetical protein
MCIYTQPLSPNSLYHSFPVINILYKSSPGLVNVVESLNEWKRPPPYEGGMLIYKLDIDEKVKIYVY